MSTAESAEHEEHVLSPVAHPCVQSWSQSIATSSPIYRSSSSSSSNSSSSSS